MHLLPGLVDVKKARDDFARVEMFTQVLERFRATRRIIVLIEFAEHDLAAVMHRDGHRVAFIVGSLDLLGRRYVIGVHDMMIELARMRIALGRALVIIEGYAGTDDVDQREARMQKCTLDQRHELFLVTGETACDVRGTEAERRAHRVDGLLLVGQAFLGFAADVRRCRELALGQAVDPVVLDDVAHIEIAAYRMYELAGPDRERVAVAGDADVHQVTVCDIRARRHGGHAPVHRIEAVRLARKICRSLRRAADAAHFGESVWFDVEFENRLHDGRCHRIMAAAGTER